MAGVATPTPPPASSSGPRTPGSGSGSSSVYGFALAPGADFGPRYYIEAVLGEGGMGAVYKAFDRELERTVAIKLLRPGMMADPVAIQRFKQELLLSSKISHKNILRIHDLGDVEGVKFITMAFVEGRDLHHIIRESGRLEAGRAVKMARQLCSALEAAHSEDVVHRDLKPQNVLVDSNDNVYIADFGLAKSLDAGAAGMTRAGEYLGTPRYMSPEQVEGKPLDNRSDIYSLGLILYQMVTGEVPFTGDSTMQLMYARLKHKPRDPRELNPAVPEYLARVILRCLEKDPRRRYQHAREILADLETEQASASRSLSITLPVPETKKGWIALGSGALAVVVLLALAFPLLRGALSRVSGPPAGEQAPMTLLIADFENRTGEPVFDGTLEPALSIALEGAAFVNSYPRAPARKLAEQIHGGPTPLSEELARLVATREGIHVVVAGDIEAQGGKYSLGVRAVDAVTGREIAGQRATADNKEAVLPTVSRLAARLRNALGDRTPESAQLAAAETFTTSSLEAAHHYARARELEVAGNWDEALQEFLKAIELDPEMGRAYSGVAVIYFNTGRVADAERYYKLAFSKIDRMSERERYRTRGAYYIVTRNPQKAIEELSELVRRYPADTAGTANLAAAYFFTRDMTRALELGHRAVELEPKDIVLRKNLGLFALYAGEFETAARELRSVLEANPAFVPAQMGLALAQYGQGLPDEARASFQKMSAESPMGASKAVLGLADMALYEGRAADAIRLLEQGAADDQKAGDTDGVAVKLVMLAEARRLAGDPAGALDATNRAASLRKGENVLFWAAMSYLALGREAQALALARDLNQRFEPEPLAYGKLIEGEAELSRGRPVEAVRSFQAAQRHVDTWLGRYALGRAYLEAGLITEADSEFEVCMKRRGEIVAAFLDETPSYRVFPYLYYYIGRVREELGSPAAAQSYKTFLDTKKDGARDPLVRDARRRLAAR